MALFHITIEKVIVKSNDELLNAINDKLDKLIAAQIDNTAIAKAASDLDQSTNKLKSAVEKNTPAT